MNTAETTEFTKFLFDTTFEETVKEKHDSENDYQAKEEVIEEEPEEPPAPTFSEEELAAARDEGYKSGKEEGLKEGLEDSARVLADILQRAGEKISRLIETQSNVAPAAEQKAVEVAVALVKTLFPDLNARHGTDEVIALVKETFESLLDEPKVTLRVAMEHREEMAAKIKEIAEQYGFEGKTIVISDENMGSGDCRIEWDSGGAERDATNVWEKIDQVIKRNTPTLSTLESSPEQPGQQETEPPQVSDTAPPEAPVQEVGVQKPISGSEEVIADQTAQPVPPLTEQGVE